MRAIPILTYHSLDASGSVLSVSPDSFAKQMNGLARAGVRGVSLREALSRRPAPAQWPNDCIVLTFDDGFANFAEHAMPVLETCGFGATVFAVSGHVGKTNDWAVPPAGATEWPLMDWDDLQTLAAAGIEIGAHTVTHPDLSTLAPHDVQRELGDCRQALHERLGTEISSLAYPFGKLTAGVADVAATIFRAAVTTELRRACDEPAHLLPRIDMFYFRDTEDLVPLVRGRHDGYLTLRRWGRRLKALLTA